MAWLTALALTQLSCGAPEMCRQQGQGTFSQFRGEQWASYCASLEARLQQPLEHELIALTEFFSEYPEESARIKKRAASYADHQRCFVSSSEQFEYRELNSCLEQGEVSTRIEQSWSVRAEAWLKEYQDRVADLTRQLDLSERDGDFITQKLEQKHALGAKAGELDRVEELARTLDAMQQEVDRIDRAQDEYERLMGASMAYASFNQYITETIKAPIDEMFEKHEANRFTIARLRTTQRFHSLAIPSLGVACEPGERANEEVRIARRVLKARMNNINAGRQIAITSPIEEIVDEETGDEFETMQGYVCGERGEDNQFEQRFKLCSQYPFEIRRIKPSGARRFNAWEVNSFEQGEAEAGVDCRLLDGPKKRSRR